MGGSKSKHFGGFKLFKSACCYSWWWFVDTGHKIANVWWVNKIIQISRSESKSRWPCSFKCSSSTTKTIGWRGQTHKKKGNENKANFRHFFSLLLHRIVSTFSCSLYLLIYPALFQCMLEWATRKWIECEQQGKKGWGVIVKILNILHSYFFYLIDFWMIQTVKFKNEGNG